MRLRLGRGAEAEELVTPDELDDEAEDEGSDSGVRGAVFVRTVTDARRALQQFRGDARAVVKLRDALHYFGAHDVSRRSDEQVIDGVAREMASGRALLVASRPHPIAMPGAPAEAEPVAVQRPKKAAATRSWVAIELVDEADQPVANEAYEIVLPDGAVWRGVLDAKGRAHVDGIKPGRCKITFPNRDQDAWSRA